jgi:glyoxylase-like metal-dependent hydrolase (beta-lactamase superfamily II)
VFSDVTTDEIVHLSWAFYLAEVEGHYTLIDTGFYDPEKMAQWGFTQSENPLELLDKLEVKPAEIETVIITHTHLDHIGLLDRFPNAKVIISRNAAEFYQTAPELPQVNEILLDTNRTQMFDESMQVDQFFTVKEIGGHLPGSSVVFFTEKENRYVLTGDECYVCQNANEQRPIGALAGDEESNLQFLKEAKANGLIALPFHDLELSKQYSVVDEGIIRVI